MLSVAVDDILPGLVSFESAARSFFRSHLRHTPRCGDLVFDIRSDLRFNVAVPSARNRHSFWKLTYVFETPTLAVAEGDSVVRKFGRGYKFGHRHVLLLN